ncbi:hypothetical protein SB8_17630 [Pseudomonas oryzihabitans]|nr:hypothetical protein SB8_17630 [Pseudomonas psychrotolerans]
MQARDSGAISSVILIENLDRRFLMQGLGKRLKVGLLRVHHQRGVDIVDESGLMVDQIAAELMTPSDWGSVYERWVGQELEKDGWEVDYRGLSLGFCDRGIDLVASLGPRTRYLQCKFQAQPINKQQIEQILYKASSFLSKQLLAQHDVFELVVPSIDTAFPPERRKNKPPQQNRKKIRFLSHNKTQNRIQLSITEIAMDLGLAQLP